MRNKEIISYRVTFLPTQVVYCYILCAQPLNPRYQPMNLRTNYRFLTLFWLLLFRPFVIRVHGFTKSDLERICTNFVAVGSALGYSTCGKAEGHTFVAVGWAGATKACGEVDIRRPWQGTKYPSTLVPPESGTEQRTMSEMGVTPAWGYTFPSWHEVPRHLPRQKVHCFQTRVISQSPGLSFTALLIVSEIN